MDPADPANKLNLRDVHVVQTRQQTREAAQQTKPEIKDQPDSNNGARIEYDNNSDTEVIIMNPAADDNEDANEFKDIMDRFNAQSVKQTDTLGELARGIRMMKNLSHTLTPYDGKDNYKHWIEDFDRYVDTAGLKEDKEKLGMLILHLKGSAKSWFRTQKDNIKAGYSELRQALKDKFEKTEFQKLTCKSELYQLKQKDDENFQDFVLRIQQKAAGLNLQESDIVAVCLQGAKTALQPFLVMAEPKSIDTLLKLPVVAEKSFEAKVTEKTSTPFVMQLITNKLDEIGEKVSQTVNNDKQNYWTKENTVKEQFSDIRKDKDVYENPSQTQRFQANAVNDYGRRFPRQNMRGYNDNYKRSAVRTNYRNGSPHPMTFNRDGRSQFDRGRHFTNPGYNGPRKIPDAQQRPAQLQGQRYRTPAEQTPVGTECNRCAFVHQAGRCPAIGRYCLYCNGPDHFARRCRKRQGQQSE